MANELRPGDVVQLRSGGPNMTVTGSSGRIRCVWMVDEDFRVGDFAAETLKLLIAAPPPEPTPMELAAEEHAKASREIKEIRARKEMLDTERDRLSALEEAARVIAHQSGERMKRLARGEPETTPAAQGVTMAPS